MKKIDNKIVRSPLFYVGDKFKLLPQLLDVFPKGIDRFFEPFTGGGSVALNVEARSYYLNDIDNNIVDIHKMLMSYKNKMPEFFNTISAIENDYGLSRSYNQDIVPYDLKAKWKKTYFAEYNRASYIRLRMDFNAQQPRDPLYLYLLLIYGFNRMIRFNNNGNFNIPVGNVDFNDNVKQALCSYFNWANASDITWANLDCINFLKKQKFSENDFVYLDPPYLITFSEYNKLWDPGKEKELLETVDKLHNSGTRFAISNVTHYKNRVNDIFLEWSKKYNVKDVKSNYISYHDNTIKSFNEVLVTNYAPTSKLQTTTIHHHFKKPRENKGVLKSSIPA